MSGSHELLAPNPQSLPHITRIEGKLFDPEIADIACERVAMMIYRDDTAGMDRHNKLLLCCSGEFANEVFEIKGIDGVVRIADKLERVLERMHTRPIPMLDHIQRSSDFRREVRMRSRVRVFPNHVLIFYRESSMRTAIAARWYVINVLRYSGRMKAVVILSFYYNRNNGSISGLLSRIGWLI